MSEHFFFLASSFTCCLFFFVFNLQHDAQLDYYGTKLATCSSDRSIKLFDVSNGQQVPIADLRGYV